MKYNKTIAGLIVVFMILWQGTSQVWAQESVSIRLLDLSTNMPIAGATFQYGDQSGQSDEKGTIKFDIKEGIHMTLSHVSYGKWKLSSSALISAIGSGVS